MKNKTALPQLGLILTLLFSAESVFAKGTPIGDLMLTGRVERAGQLLVNNTTLFEGDTIKTLAGSGGVVRIGRGRLEIDPQSEVEIVSEKPLKIAVKSGGLHFNFPVGTDFEIVTPQLDIRPTLGTGSYSGTITAQPKKEDRVTSRVGRYSILEREVGGDTNTIHEGQVLVASLALPALPQGGANNSIIATITDLSPVNAQVSVGRAANPKNTSTRATVGLGLANGDRVVSLQGNARIQFADDGSVITLRPGTDVTIQHAMEAGSLVRSISQAAGSLWFSITKATNTQTRLSTPTAVAAIRGTEGQQDIDQTLIGSTTYSLTDGVEDIQETLTGARVTIRAGQSVVAIRGVGFTAISALLGVIGPAVGGAGPGGPGAVAGGAAGGGAGGGVAGTGAAVASTSTAAVTAASTVSSVVTATLGVVAPTTAAFFVAVQEEDVASASGPRTCPGTCNVP